jgi:hypothetical protein
VEVGSVSTTTHAITVATMPPSVCFIGNYATTLTWSPFITSLLRQRKISPRPLDAKTHLASLIANVLSITTALTALAQDKTMPATTQPFINPSMIQMEPGQNQPLRTVARVRNATFQTNVPSTPSTNCSAKTRLAIIKSATAPISMPASMTPLRPRRIMLLPLIDAPSLHVSQILNAKAGSATIPRA